MRALCLLGFALLVLAGCTQVTADRIKKRYTDQVRLLDIVPVYPPREDVQVGDLRLEYLYPGQEEGTVSEDFGSSKALIEQAEQNLAKRILFSTTLYDTEGKPTLASRGIALGANGRAETRADAKSYPLPQVAFARVTVRATNSFSAGLLSPLQALGLLVGNSSEVSLDFNDVRVFGTTRDQAITISEVDVCKIIENESKFNQLREGLIARAKEYDDKNKIPQQERMKRKFQIKLVSQVYLTRSITYIYNNAQIRAAAAQALKGGKAAAGTVPVPTIINVNGNVAQDAVPNFTSAAAGAAPPANGVSIGSVTSLGVSVVRDFERPVVVGYAGADYDLGGAWTKPAANGKPSNGKSGEGEATQGTGEEGADKDPVSPFAKFADDCADPNAIPQSKPSIAPYQLRSFR